jgi:hypothetical protein
VPLSRLRLRLSAAFALAFGLGLAVLNTALFLVLRRDADRLLTHRLEAAATEVAEALAREYGEAPERGLAVAARETFREWPATGNSFVVYDGAGARLATLGNPARLAAAPAAFHAGDAGVLDRVAGARDHVRLVADQLIREGDVTPTSGCWRSGPARRPRSAWKPWGGGCWRAHRWWCCSASAAGTRSRGWLSGPLPRSSAPSRPSTRRTSRAASR